VSKLLASIFYQYDALIFCEIWKKKYINFPLKKLKVFFQKRAQHALWTQIFILKDKNTKENIQYSGADLDT
jgi:hypothetical protein